MSAVIDVHSSPKVSRVQGAYDLLGGPKVLGRRPDSSLALHRLLTHGLSHAATGKLLAAYPGLTEAALAEVLGISQRTLQRQREAPGQAMTADQGSRLWRFADILASATEVLGGKAEAVAWLHTPALGLDQSLPLELMRTVQGAELVADFLGRLEYGVYN